MNLRTIPTWRLREMIADTERAAKPDAVALAILRREASRREADRSQTPKAVTSGN